MRILLSPAAYKATLSAPEAAAAMAAALPRDEVRILPVADGGEGTAEAIGRARGGHWVPVPVHGPLGAPVEAGYWVLPPDRGARITAVTEMRCAAGFDLVPEGERDPWAASTYGVGQLLLAARTAEVDRLLIGIGGSATNDGGSGMAKALGYRFLDTAGRDIEEIPARLGEVAELFPDLALDLPEVSVACDVDNPLLGPSGATRVFGPQKGVAPESIEAQEARLAHWADLVASETGEDCRDTPGSGAAGGLGFGLIALCGAELTPGFELVVGALGLVEAIAQADLVITGEGRLDASTGMGKAPAGVARLARAAGVPVVAFPGSSSGEPAIEGEFDAVFPLARTPEEVRSAMADPHATLELKVAEARGRMEGWRP